MAQNRQKVLTTAKKTAEELEREREVLREQSDALRLEFVVSELDLGITFCHSAASTRDKKRNRRNLACAEEAYQTARHFIEKEQISDPLRGTIQEKATKLESLLRELKGRE